MNVNRSAIGLIQSLKISNGLRSLELSKRVGLRWHGQIFFRACAEHKKHAVVAAAFVELACGVQIARPISEQRRALRFLTQERADFLQLRIGFFIKRQKREHAKIISITDGGLINKRLQCFFKRRWVQAIFG